MATPSNPAPVSGPGALSQRTDGGPGNERQPIRDLPNPAYGEGQEFRAMQAGAPMFQQQDMPTAPVPPGLFDPTGRPDEPVTSGIASGPGAGPEPVMDAEQMKNRDIQLIMGYMPAMRRAAGAVNAPTAFKSFVRYLETYRG